MANGLVPLAGLCALYLVCVGCSSDSDPDTSSAAGAAVGGAGALPGAGRAGASVSAGAESYGGKAASSGGTESGGKAAGANASAGANATAGSAGKASTGSGGVPAAVDGGSVYALECHGESKDCNRAAVPCFGVGSPTPDVPAGWACANRCNSNADCSDAPSGAEAQAACVAFSSAKHCMLVCKNESEAFACPAGMSCYVLDKAPVGYCLWQ